MFKAACLLALSGIIAAQDCNPGFFNNGTGICSSCPTGSFSLAAAAECTNCSVGFTQLDLSEENTDASSCLTGCEAGYGGADCDMCGAGFYSVNVTAAIELEPCTECETGFTTSGLFPASSCLLCAKGFGGVDCEPCATGQTSPEANQPADDECYDKACGFCNRENDICSVTDDSVSPFEFSCVCKEHTDGSTFYGSDCSLNACSHPDVTAKFGAGVDSCLSKGNPYSNEPEITCQDGYSTLPGGKFCDNEICGPDACENGSCTVVNSEARCDCSVADANGETFYGPKCQYSICDNGANAGKTDKQMCRKGYCRSDVMMNVQDNSPNLKNTDSANPKQYFCECERGYAMNNLGRCKKDINECTTGSNICENDSKCKNKKPRKHSGFGYQCKCKPENYQGTNPDPSFIKKGVCDGLYNDCEDSPCGDVANTCVDGTRVTKNKKSYTCTCAEGYELRTNKRRETTCSPKNPCDENSGYGPCQNNGVCSWDGSFNGFTCACPSGWQGQKCTDEQDPCTGGRDPCQNSGVCSRGVEGSASCDCAGLDFQGQFCQDQKVTVVVTPLDIKKGRCKKSSTYGVAKITDTNNRDFKAFRRITAVLQYRLKQGAFTDVSAITFDYVDCSDRTSRVGRYSFYEYSPVSGSRKKRSIEFNSRSIRSVHDSLAAIMDAINDANDPNFSIPGVELPSQNFTDTIDTTQGGSEALGENFDGCQLDSEGLAGGCQNNAECVDLQDSLSEIYGNNSCTCATGYSGDNCEISTNECDELECGINGACSDYLGYAKCVCDSGFSGDGCETDDFCAGNLCSGRGTCVNGGCVCNPSTGYVASGDNCEIVDFCQFTDSFMVLQNFTCNFGECAQDEVYGAYCVCDEGYGDESLSQYNETCAYQDPCVLMNCGDNGSCFYSDSSSQHACLCNFGWTGNACDEPDMCISQNGNNCEMAYTLACSNDNSTAGYTCSCAEGYSGENCSIGPCDVSSEFYTCDATYSDVDSCYGVGGYGVCSCTADSSRTDCGVWGPACDPIATDCNSENTASCDVNVNGTAICTCLSGYVGDYCDDLFVATTTVIVTTTEAVTTQAPVVTTQAPVVTTQAPVVTTQAPVVTTQAPVVTTQAPVVTTQAPVVTTQAPVVTTQAPVVTTQAPVLTTQAPGTTAGPTTPSGPTTTLPPAVMPPQCPTHPTPASEDKQVSFAYITTISNLIKDNIRGKGNCLDVIHQRIYASLQLSRDLVQYGNGWMDQFDGFQDNSKALELDNYSMRMKNNFRDAFEFCESGSCVVESFCEGLSNDSLFPGSVSLKAQVEERCLAEGWRFQQIISSGTTDSCEFTYVPLPFAEKACPTA